MQLKTNIHPGVVLKEEFLDPMNVTAYRLAKEIGIQQTRISQIINGNRSITADTAIRLSLFFGTSEEFWMNLQREYDLRRVRLEKGDELNRIRRFEMA